MRRRKKVWRPRPASETSLAGLRRRLSSVCGCRPSLSQCVPLECVPTEDLPVGRVSSGDRVESGGGLIEQQQRWPAGELQRDGQPPLLPAADTLLPFWVADEDIAALGEAKLSQELLAPRSPIGRRRGAAHLEEARLRQRLVHRQRRREQVVLRHKGCEAPHGSAVIRGTVYADCAAGRRRHARERVEERGLPRAARPHDGHELSRAERTRYRVQDQLPALPFRAHFDADAGKGEADRPGRSLGNRRRLDIAHPSTDRR